MGSQQESKKKPRRWLRACGCLLLGLLLLLVLAFFQRKRIYDRIGGAFTRTPAQVDELSLAASKLVDQAFAGLDRSRLVDVHVHLAGLGTDDSGCELHPHMQSWSSPRRRARFEVYLHASGVADMEHADAEFVERIADLARHFRSRGEAPIGPDAPGARFALLAFDRFYSEEGESDPERTEFHVPNEWVWKAVEDHPGLFVPVLSIHPYRKDAVEQLEAWADRGVRLIKWLPNAMGIDPSSPLCDEFYAAMVRRDVTLLTHTGHEMAVEAEELQVLGDPLRLRRALDAGVRVIAAHCASTGTVTAEDGTVRPAFEAFLQLMGEERYEGLLYGELSTLTQLNRLGRPLEVVLARDDLRGRYINGSDYPLPAISLLYSTRQLEGGGWITASERKALQEVYDVNPLLFDFVLKRTLRHPRTGQRLEDQDFEWPADVPLFEPN
ncbi:MAG: amidohydrolase [Planctomycetota bacterium]